MKFDTSGVVIPATVEEGRTVTREFLFRVNTWTCTREDGVADNIVSPFVGPFAGIIYGAFRIMPPLYHHRGQVAAVYNLTKRYTQKRVRFLGESISSFFSIGSVPLFFFTKIEFIKINSPFKLLTSPIIFVNQLLFNRTIIIFLFFLLWSKLYREYDLYKLLIPRTKINRSRGENGQTSASLSNNVAHGGNFSSMVSNSRQRNQLEFLMSNTHDAIYRRLRFHQDYLLIFIFQRAQRNAPNTGGRVFIGSRENACSSL